MPDENTHIFLFDCISFIYIILHVGFLPLLFFFRLSVFFFSARYQSTSLTSWWKDSATLMFWAALTSRNETPHFFAKSMPSCAETCLSGESLLLLKKRLKQKSRYKNIRYQHNWKVGIFKLHSKYVSSKFAGLFETWATCHGIHEKEALCAFHIVIT